MKKAIIILCVLVLAVTLIAAKPWTSVQTKAHEIADMARDLGLPEDNPIIAECQKLWAFETDEMRILANVVYYESGNCTDRHQQLVAQVVLNRVASERFPNTVYDVVIAPKQYNPIYVRNLPSYISADATMQRCFENAYLAYMGKVECPKNVFYQSEFSYLGTGNYETIVPPVGQTTYFNYG